MICVMSPPEFERNPCRNRKGCLYVSLLERATTLPVPVIILNALYCRLRPGSGEKDKRNHKKPQRNDGPNSRFPQKI